MTIKNTYFGELKYDKSVNWLSTSISRENIKIDFYISLDDTENSEAAIYEAEKVCRNIDFYIIKAEGFAVHKLLDLKNQTWLEEGEQKLTKDVFINRMKLKSITVYSYGLIELWYDDGDLFWGHMIRVSIEKDGSLFNVELEG